DLGELYDFLELKDLKVKGRKKMDADELRASIIVLLGLDVEIEKEAASQEEPAKKTEQEKPTVDTGLLIAAVGDCETLDDYEELLQGMSRKALIKHINKFKMPILTEGLDEDEIVTSICTLMSENMATQ